MSEATEQVAAEREIRPHGGKVVLLLGILGILGLAFCLPIGAFAWYFGSRELDQMRLGLVDPAGRNHVAAGRALGIAGVVLWAGLAGLAGLSLLAIYD
jgi:hypothetical protein